MTSSLAVNSGASPTPRADGEAVDAGIFSLAKENRNSSEYQLVRVHGSENPVGEWMMRSHEIEGVILVEIQQKYSLPNEPTYVSSVDAPAETPVRTETVAEAVRAALYNSSSWIRRFRLILQSTADHRLKQLPT